ncbi:MAG: AAA family ATPase [Candidatus Anammoximicrobium sp.]|nr:AAA family ATPase [Candidatus Anammoximicrobium sp.]
MKISDLQIDGFGVWSNLKLDRFADGLTVFCGPNEAGKTTLMQFIRSILYGFSTERRSRYLPPVHGGRAGGSLGAVDTGGRFTVRRTPSNSLSSDDPGKVEVLSASGARQGSHVLATMLCGIDETIYNNVFAVGLRELQELGTLDDTAAAAQLYKLTSGLDRVSLIDVMRDTETARNRILAPDASDSQLLNLLRQREQLQGQIHELTTRSERWSQLAAQRKELQDEVARLEESIERMELDAQAVEVALQIREPWFRRLEVRQKLAELGAPRELPERAVQRLDGLNAQIRTLREQVDQLQRKRRTLVEEAAAQPINRPLWAHASRIEAICEHGPWIESLENQVKHLHDEIGQLDETLRAKWEKLGLSADDLPEFTPDFSQRTSAALKGPARALREANDRLAAARTDGDEVRRQAQEIQDQLAVELAETGETQLDKALEKAGHRVTRLRRRLQVEERLEKLDRHRKELDEDRRDLMEEQILPVSTLFWCGVPFVLGVMLVLASIFWEPVAKLGWIITILGLACWAIAVITKVLLEKTMSRDLEACIRQLDKVKGQIRTLKEERDELDVQLPGGGGPLDARLAAAEAYVKKLESLTPLDAKIQTALAQAEAGNDKAERAAAEVKAVQQRWREALRTLKLPESFLPEHIQQFTDGSDQAAQLAQRLHSRREELRDRRHELATITERISLLLEDIHLTATSDDPRTQIRQMAALMAEQKQWVERRRQLKTDHRELKKAFREHSRQLRELLRQRQLLLKQANVADEAELRSESARQDSILEFSEEHEELNERITLAIGNRSSEAAVGEVLETHGEEKLEPFRDRLAARLEDSQERLTQLHQSQGEMNQEMKTLAEDRQLAAAKLQLGCVEEQMRIAVQRWRVLAVTALMLEAIRQIYETERQPETLAEASTYLERFTEGRYTRIWTPLSADVLRVDGSDGQSMSLDLLSQGTREAVFLSLRLALSAAYARRGAVLPLVLDDVLVNFDARRARSAATVLRDFANAGHQMLMFTCHQHIMQIFEAAGAEIRLLPVRNGVDGFDWYDEPSLQPPVAAKSEPAEVAAALAVEPEPIEEPIEEPEEELPPAAPEWEPAAAELDDETAEEDAEEHPEEDAEEDAESDLDDDDSPDRSQWLEADVPEPPEDETPEPVWDDDELRLAEDDRQPALAGASKTSEFKTCWWEDDDAAA